MNSVTLALAVLCLSGFALGAATALLGPEAAMACTAAVETEIDRHYEEQLVELADTDPELTADIREFQAEELEHRDTAREAGAANAPAYPLLTFAIRGVCRAAMNDGGEIGGAFAVGHHRPIAECGLEHQRELASSAERASVDGGDEDHAGLAYEPAHVVETAKIGHPAGSCSGEHGPSSGQGVGNLADPQGC